MRDLERRGDILLHQQDGDAARVDLPDDTEKLEHDRRREAKRGLIEKEELGLGHQRAADGHHLLLPAGERARGRLEPGFEDRKQSADLAQGLRPRARAPPRGSRRARGFRAP